MDPTSVPPPLPTLAVELVRMSEAAPAEVTSKPAPTLAQGAVTPGAGAGGAGAGGARGGDEQGVNVAAGRVAEQAGRSVCSVSVSWSESELATLSALPFPGERVAERAWCELEDGHPGWHWGLGQVSDEDWWWLRWDTDSDEGRRLIRVGFCGDIGARCVECWLPKGHVGAHGHLLHPT